MVGGGGFFFLISDILYTSPSGSSVGGLHIPKARMAGFAIFFSYAPPKPSSCTYTCTYLCVCAPACQCAIGGICHGLMPRARISIASLMCCRSNAGERCSESCTCSKVRQRAGYEALFAGAWGGVGKRGGDWLWAGAGPFGESRISVTGQRLPKVRSALKLWAHGLVSCFMQPTF